MNNLAKNQSLEDNNYTKLTAAVLKKQVNSNDNGLLTVPTGSHNITSEFKQNKNANGNFLKRDVIRRFGPACPAIPRSLSEDVPVIVRRRGCTLRVRIASITEGDLERLRESDGGAPHSPGPPLSPSASYRRSQEDIPFCNPGGIRRLQRTLSEDVRQRRRESLTLPSSPISVPNNLVSAGSSSSTSSTIGHNLNALLEPTNLMKMKNTVLGQSAPSLTAGIKEFNMLSKRGKVRKSLVNTSPVLPIRCPSPQPPHGKSV
ncbi:MAST [Mytilus coruscus]|uniref:MAST n=1 Tax=Mytilus coruscus TaxID=42192 RepID=A0A6J8CQM6_MYTCO|nr:MAST [Mytilus coruscus]